MRQSGAHVLAKGFATALFFAMLFGTLCEVLGKNYEGIYVPYMLLCVVFDITFSFLVVWTDKRFNADVIDAITISIYRGCSILFLCLGSVNITSSHVFVGVTMVVLGVVGVINRLRAEFVLRMK